MKKPEPSNLLIVRAYEKARAESSDLVELPTWEQLDVEMRCALISVFHAGAQHGLDRMEKQLETIAS